MRQQEDLLQQILGVGGVPEHPTGQVVQPRRVLAVQLLEGAYIAPSATGHQVGVGWSHVTYRLDEKRGYRALPARFGGRLAPQGY